MVMQIGPRPLAHRDDRLCPSVIDVVVQLGREGAERKIVAIEELSPTSWPREPTLRGALDKLCAA